MEWLEKNTKYHMNWKSGTDDFTVYGALGKKSCVCEGYAKGYKLLCNAVGVKCIYTTMAIHAFNIVSIGGNWYLANPTANEFDTDNEWKRLDNQWLKSISTNFSIYDKFH